VAKLALAFDILARDKNATKTFNDVGGAAEKAGKRGEGFGRAIKGAMGVAAGAIAAAGLASAFGGFVQDAAESAKIARLTGAVIKSTGGVARVTAKQVDTLATAISNKTAVDDEAIQSGANLLLTFTNVRNEVGKGNDIFDQATQAAVDMSVALGTDVAGASLQLGKALNDPIKGVTALSRAGVSFTEQQKDQIRTMVEAGDTLGAQKIILEEMGKQFGGAAEAAAGPLDRLKTIAGNLGEQVGGVLLPHIEGFATFLGETAAPKVAEFLGQMESGEGAGGKFRDGLEWVRGKAIELRDAFVNEVIPRLTEFRDFVRDEVAPKVREFADAFSEHVQPAIGDVDRFIRESFRPGLEEFKEQLDKSIIPALDDLKVAFGLDEDAVVNLDGAFVDLESQLGEFTTAGAQFAGWLSTTFLRAVTMTKESVEALKDLWKDTKTNVQEFMDTVRDFKLPGWVSKIVEILSADLTSGNKGLRGLFAGLTGDGPGRFGGGNTLNRVKGILPAGAAITSTYRTPAQNAAVGGVVGSYHTDRANPAVDIAGSRAAMDQVYARLAAMGGWRELLYKTAGHWDHVHVAHNGGEVSANWPKMPGWGANERPVRAEVGEVIVPKGAAGGKTYNINVTQLERRMTGADFVAATRAAEMMDPEW
jgi:hypothetical protein